MRTDNVRVIAAREYLARIRTKGFWIATVGLPLLMAAALVLPALLLTQTRGTHELVIVDTMGALGEALVAELTHAPEIEAAREVIAEALPGADTSVVDNLDGIIPRLEAPAEDLESQRADLDRRVRAGEIDAWIWVDQAGMDADRVEYHAESVSNFVTQARLQRAVSSVVRSYRLRQAGLDPEEIRRLGREVDLGTVRVTEEGSRQEGAASGIVLAYTLFFLLYISILVYGQQVMIGVIEEKSSRIVEVIVATTRPFDLMMGKLIGICCVALTQLAIWMTAVVVLTLPPVVAQMAWLSRAGVDIPTVAPSLLVHFFLFFVLGFFLFSAFYGSVGAAFNNIQEAQQFASVGAIFAVAPMLLFWMVLNDPDSPLSVVASLIPFFTPLLMLLRLAVKEPPFWQVLLGYVLTVGLTWGMVWVSARIYRVGILMYGKKPSLPEIWRWIRVA
jgi:ABC-2 type transport system permease protein